VKVAQLFAVVKIVTFLTVRWMNLLGEAANAETNGSILMI